MQGEQSKPDESTQQRRRSSHAFLVLTLLTISIAICYVPNQVVFTIVMFMPLDLTGVLYGAVTICYYMESVLDPLYFALAIDSLRTEVIRIIRR